MSLCNRLHNYSDGRFQAHSPIGGLSAQATKAANLSSFSFKTSELHTDTNLTRFRTATFRPIYAQDPHPLYEFSLHPDTAIIIPGKVIESFDFTAETVKLYQTIFPASPVFVSTWSDTPESTLEGLEKNGATVVLSEPPDIAGEGSSNFHAVASNKGLSAAKNAGLPFSLKTRPDQRVHNPLVIDQVKGLMREFPLLAVPNEPQLERIVSTSFDSFAFRLFGLSDMFQFGTTQDLLLYWDGQIDRRPKSDFAIKNQASIREIAQLRVAETHHMLNFLEKVGWDVDWSFTNYWLAASNRFVIVDHAPMDFFWPKFTLRENRWSSYSYFPSHQLFDFAFWLKLRRGMPDLDHLLDLTQEAFAPAVGRETNARYP